MGVVDEEIPMLNFMQIESISIRNYRCFRAIELNDLSRMTVVVGANGSGKSSLFDVFTFPKDALTQNAAYAVAQRGGYRELVSRGQEGPIEIAVKFRKRGGQLATYWLKINLYNGRVVVDHEALGYRKGQTGKPWPGQSRTLQYSAKFAHFTGITPEFGAFRTRPALHIASVRPVVAANPLLSRSSR